MKAFNEISFLDFPEIFYKKIENEIFSRGKDYVLQVEEEEYIKYLVDKYSLEPLCILQETVHIGEPEKSTVKRRDIFGEDYLADAFKFHVTYNFTGDAELFRIQPNPRALVSYDIAVNEANSTVTYSFTISRQDVNEFNIAKARGYSDAFTNLNAVNTNIEQMMSGFDGMVRAMFSRIKNSYKTENDFYTAVNIKTNPNTTSVFSAPTIKKKETFQPKVSEKKEFAAQPTMTQSMYDEILKAIYDCGKNMEKKPSLYISKDEEGLRDQFIFILETKYEGTTASGETFNRSGKTDIILKFAQDGSNLFVAECKIWHGTSEMLKAISQLLSYLTWRDSKTALMLFVQNQGFTNILDTITTEISKHPQFKKENGKRGESSFSYIFGLPQDPDKEIQLEIMTFHYDKK